LIRSLNKGQGLFSYNTFRTDRQTDDDRQTQHCSIKLSWRNVSKLQGQATEPIKAAQYNKQGLNVNLNYVKNGLVPISHTVPAMVLSTHCAVGTAVFSSWSVDQ